MKGSRNALQQLSHIFIYTPSVSKLSPSHTSHTHTHTAQRPKPSKHGNWVHCLYSSKQHRLRIKRHTTNTASQKITERKRPRVYHGTTLVECTYPPPPFVSLQLLCGSARRQQISVLLVCLSPPRVPIVAHVT